MGLVLVVVIHFVTVRWDQRYDWRQHTAKRIWRQLVFGLITPAVLDFIFMSIYLKGVGQNLGYEKFKNFDLLVVICFLLILNLYYVIHYFAVKPKPSISDNFLTEEKRSDVLIIDSKKMHVRLPLEDIMYFEKDKKKILIYTIDGNQHEITESLSNMVIRFQDFGFHKINRSIIINGVIVEGHGKGDAKKTRRILIKAKYDEAVKIPQDKLIVTKSQLITLNKWFGDSVD